MNHKSPVIVKKIVEASLEKVWEALTDKNEMKQWFFDVDHFELKEGFEFRFAGQGRKGEKYMHICNHYRNDSMQKTPAPLTIRRFAGLLCRNF